MYSSPAAFDANSFAIIEERKYLPNSCHIIYAFHKYSWLHAIGMHDQPQSVVSADKWANIHILYMIKYGAQSNMASIELCEAD